MNRNTSCCSSSIAESYPSVVSRLSRCFSITRVRWAEDTDKYIMLSLSCWSSRQQQNYHLQCCSWQVVNCVTNTTYTVPADTRPLCDSEVPIISPSKFEHHPIRLVQPADRCLIQVAPMSLVACSTAPRQLTMTLQALLKDALTEPR